MSGDEQLIQRLPGGARDIHRLTASQVFHTPFDQVTDLQRRNAKAVNFGIVYGISSFGLSSGLEHHPERGFQEYIQNTILPPIREIKEFLDTCVTQAKEKGYARDAVTAGADAPCRS